MKTIMMYPVKSVTRGMISLPVMPAVTPAELTQAEQTPAELTQVVRILVVRIPAEAWD